MQQTTVFKRQNFPFVLRQHIFHNTYQSLAFVKDYPVEHSHGNVEIHNSGEKGHKRACRESCERKLVTFKKLLKFLLFIVEPDLDLVS